MQIKIVQVEIEEAIRNHIERQIKVREGMKIDIDLSATRGPEGFIATIDIVPAETQEQTVEAEPAKPPVAEVAVTPRRGRPPGSTNAAPKADPVVAAKPEPEVVTEAPEVEQASDEVVDENQGNQDAVAATETAQEAQLADGSTTAAPAGKSLFGGLQRPNNA